MNTAVHVKGHAALERLTPSTTAPNTPASGNSSSVPTTPVSMVPGGMAQASCLYVAIQSALHLKHEMYDQVISHAIARATGMDTLAKLNKVAELLALQKQMKELEKLRVKNPIPVYTGCP